MNEANTVTSLFENGFRTLDGDFGPLKQVLGIVLFVLLFNFVIKAFLSYLRRKFARQNKPWRYSFVKGLQKPLFYLVWFIALLYTADYFSTRFLGIHFSNIHFILSVVGVLAFGWFLLRWNKEFIHYMREIGITQPTQYSPFKLDLMSKLATIGAVFITIFLLLDVTGRSVQTLIAFGGIGGLALAFASQQAISNFFGGGMIYLTRPFTIGEWINLPEKNIEGHVEEIGWYLTRIRNFEKRPIYVPNSIFTQTTVITPSRMSHERFHYIINLRLKDFKIVKSIVDRFKQMLLNHPSIDKHLKTEVYFTNITAEGLEIEISAYISSSGEINFKELRQELLLQIGDIIEKEGGEIAQTNKLFEIHQRSESAAK